MVNGGGESDCGVAHGALLIAFAEAAMGNDDDALERQRAALRAVLTPAQPVDTAALIGLFNVVDRVADSTGIPLDSIIHTLSGEIPRELNLTRFQSSANTPAAA